MQCNIVADGAGARGLYAFAGATEEIQKQYEIKNFAGVSAGAVVGALVKTGSLNTNDTSLIKKVINVACDHFEGWKWPKDLQIFISNLQTGRSEIFDHQSSVSLSEAIIKSCSLYPDGTITSDFPYIAGLNKNKDTDIPTFGLFLYLDEPVPSYLDPNNPKDLFLAHFNYVDAQRIYREHLRSTVKKIIYIPVMDILATNFDLTDEQKEQLYNNGREAAREFFKEYGDT